jgi:hypothetical protein
VGISSEADVLRIPRLVTTIGPCVFEAINNYLDETHDAEQAVPYGDPAQAAMEVQFELDRRWPGAVRLVSAKRTH